MGIRVDQYTGVFFTLGGQSAGIVGRNKHKAGPDAGEIHMHQKIGRGIRAIVLHDGQRALVCQRRGCRHLEGVFFVC